METPAVPLLAEKQHSGYNNFFTLIGKLKMPVYIDEQGNARGLSYKVPNCHKFYHLTYEEAYQQLSEYRKKHPDTSGRVSLWLDNAKYNDLFVFILDFDKIEDENGQKQPVDTEAPFFKGALQLAAGPKVLYVGQVKIPRWTGEIKSISFAMFHTLFMSGRNGTIPRD